MSEYPGVRPSHTLITVSPSKPKVHLSGAITYGQTPTDDDHGEDTPVQRRIRFYHKRRKLVAALQDAGLEPTNLYGEEHLSLLDIEDNTIKPNDAFVLLPVPLNEQLSTEEMHLVFQEFFEAASLAVGIQTQDEFLQLPAQTPNGKPHKPVVILNSFNYQKPEHSFPWDLFRNLMLHLHAVGTLSQHPDDLIRYVKDVPGVVAALCQPSLKPAKPSINLHHHYVPEDVHKSIVVKEKPSFNVCVFCSASTSNPLLLQSAHALGKDIARHGWGLVTGAGSTGMMGQVVQGCAEIIKETGYGWTGGANLMRIFNLEGLPAYMNDIWVTPDIYSRMHRMIVESEAFIVMPGGMGTVQEFMALLLLKHEYLKQSDTETNIMQGKPVIVANLKIEKEGKQIGFWDPLIRLAKKYGFEKDMLVVSTVEEAIEVLENIQPLTRQA